MVVHFNNPESMAGTVAHLAQVGFGPERIVVYDNGSEATQREQARAACVALGCEFVASAVNHGWGGAINDFLRGRSWQDDDLLLIAAHDARILSIDFAEIEREFSRSERLFVSPCTVNDMEGLYSAARAFWFRKAAPDAVSQVQVGHATACFARPSRLGEIGFDEEYFIYGCESEVFLRANDAGYVTTMLRSFVVDNAATDSSSDFCTRAFAINSMYTAWKRHGLGGALQRAGALAGSALRLRLAGDRSGSRIKLAAALYGVTHPRAGLRTYLRQRGRD